MSFFAHHSVGLYYIAYNDDDDICSSAFDTFDNVMLSAKVCRSKYVFFEGCSVYGNLLKLVSLIKRNIILQLTLSVCETSFSS